MSRCSADLAHDRFADHFNRREVRTQQIEIRGIEPLQQLVGRAAAHGHAG
ncbi:MULTISPECIES: hypothetical protein [unclassified Bradyrhizobium]|nr:MULTISPECIES: hypothetical protein [unclassified Bradyrhizobium]